MHGATAHAIGAATHEIFTYDEEGNLLTPNFYDYHVPHALDMPPIKNGNLESPSPFSPLGAKGMGEGGGAGIHAVCAALQDALEVARRADDLAQLQPAARRVGAPAEPESARSRWWTHEGRRHALVRGSARDGLGRPEQSRADGEAHARASSRSRSRTRRTGART